LLSRAIKAGLLVHPYTLRAEEPFLTQTANAISQTALAEAIQLYGLGVNGFFIDQPDVGVAAHDIFLNLNQPDRAGRVAGASDEWDIVWGAWQRGILSTSAHTHDRRQP
jgi:hypothetical protein